MKTLEKEDVNEARNGAADKGKTKIYLIDDHPIMVQGLKELINNQKDLKVIGSSDDWHEALEQVKKMQPDLIMLDVTLKDANGIEVLKNLKIHVPHIKILMLSMHDENLYADWGQCRYLWYGNRRDFRHIILAQYRNHSPMGSKANQYKTFSR